MVVQDYRRKGRSKNYAMSRSILRKQSTKLGSQSKEVKRMIILNCVFTFSFDFASRSFTS